MPGSGAGGRWDLGRSAADRAAVYKWLDSPRRNGTLYPVTGRNGVNVGRTNDTAKNKQSIRRRMRSGKRPLTNLRARVTNWYIDTASGAETSTGNDIRVAISIEYPVGATPKPLFFYGASDIVVPNGGALDALELSGLVIPADAAFYVHYFARGWAGGAEGDTYLSVASQ
jgi:hypothetical protein